MNSSFCQICNRQLTDPASIAAGVGPECAAKRTGFLSTCGTSETELVSLETANPYAARWVRNFRQDMRAGRTRQARQCLDAARRNAAPVVAAPVAPVVASVVNASEPPTPAIVVRPSDRGFRVHPPYKHSQFVAAYKKTVGGRWYPESAEWFIPATCLEWTKELLEYWFNQPVYIEPAAR